MLVFGGCGSAVLAAAFPEVGIGLVGVSLAFRADCTHHGLCRRSRFGRTLQSCGYRWTLHCSSHPSGRPRSLHNCADSRSGGRGGSPVINSERQTGVRITRQRTCRKRLRRTYRPEDNSLLAGFIAETVLTFFFLVIILGSTESEPPRVLARLQSVWDSRSFTLISIPVTKHVRESRTQPGPAVFVGGWALTHNCGSSGWRHYLARNPGGSVVSDAGSRHRNLCRCGR
jgi:aquaporin Z